MSYNLIEDGEGIGAKSQVSVRSKFIKLSISIAGYASQYLRIRGFWHISKILGKFTSVGTVVSVKIGSSSRFFFDLSDPYWNRMCFQRYRYEPEVLTIIRKISRINNLVFLDCGSNFGFWSVMATDESLRIPYVIAIEASKKNFEYLQLNGAKNGHKFLTLNRAVHEISGMTMSFLDDGISHANSRLVESGLESADIETISIDDALRDIPSDYPVVIKLDVEGAEVSALRGAKVTLVRDCCIIFEDHGNDRASVVTDWILKNTDFHVFWLSDQGEHLVPIASVRELSGLKSNPKVGYNLIAIREGSKFFEIVDSLEVQKGG